MTLPFDGVLLAGGAEPGSWEAQHCLQLLERIDRWLLLNLQQLSPNWMAPLWRAITPKWAGAPVYVFLAYRLWRVDRRGFFWVLLGIALALVCADQLSSGLLKPWVARLRPCQEALNARYAYQLPYPELCRSLYGFVSSHAANSLALVGVLSWRRRRLGGWAWGTLLAWVLLHVLSRLFLGLHYPGDLLVGGLLGFGLGAFWGWAATFIIQFRERPGP